MSDPSKLRDKAKLELKSQLNNFDLPEGLELKAVIQELRIHQIELEMQNDELQKAQVKLEASRNRYKELYEFAPVGIFTCDPDGIIMTANATMKNLLGVPSSDLQGASFAQFSAPSSQDTYYHHAREVLASGSEKSCTIALIRSDGISLLVDMKSHVEEVAGKQCIRTSLLDITDRAQAEAHLHLTSRAIEKTAEGIMITDSKGMILNVNPAFCAITGYETHEVIGKNPGILHSGKQDAAFYKNMWEKLRETGQWRGKIWNRRKNGEVYAETLCISAICNEANEVSNYIGLFSDISEKLLLEEQFYQAQKMETVGTMVGGIAHNFNNMLAGITGNIYLAKQKVQAQSDVAQKLSNIEEFSFRAAEMIQQLLAFARKSMVSMKELPLSPFLKETLKLLSAAVPENIAVHQDICIDSLLIKGDDTLLHQVLANLLNNARDAVDGANKPCITIKLESFHANDVWIESHPYFVIGNYAHLSVKDNGCGIPKHQLEHLFDPFFTTKEEGKGTGLGLSMLFGAIKTHQGFVDVDSKEGKGSTFHIYLPLLKTEARAAKPVLKQATTKGRGELILLVDDELMVREVLAEVLKSLDYNVLTAKDGIEAIEVFKVHQKEISLVLLDVVMPHLGGMPLAIKIREINPDIPAIFLTGYDQEHVQVGNERLANSEIISKPANIETLSHLIQQLLG